MKRQAFMIPKKELGMWKRNDDEPQSGEFKMMYIENIKEDVASGVSGGDVIGMFWGSDRTPFTLPMDTIREHYHIYRPNKVRIKS